MLASVYGNACTVVCIFGYGLVLSLLAWGCVCVKVLLSVLANPLNQTGWPRVLGQDILKHLEQLRSRAVALRGRAQGRTLLPLPLSVDRKDEQQLRFVCVPYRFTFTL